MFRNLTIVAVAALGLFASAPTASADPAPARPAVGAHDHYTVYYRKCEHEAWTRHGCYDCICEASKAADGLKAQGFQTTIFKG